MESRKVGIITSSTPLFNSGLVQNAYFIYDVLTNSGFETDLLCYDPAYTKLEYKDTPIKTISQDIKQFDPSPYRLIITVATGITKDMYAKCQKTKTRVAGFICGAVLQMNMESFISDKSSTTITNSQPIDQLWIIGEYSYMCSYMEVLRNAPSKIVPHLWSPSLIEYTTEHTFKKPPTTLVYNPQVHTKKKATIIIMEPNLYIVKNAVIPIMAAEQFYITHPDLVDEVFIFNFPTKSESANAIIDSLSVRPKIRIFKSLHIAEVLTHFNSKDTVPIFVSFHQHNPWNYLTYELLYYGYPLVHNSDDFKSYGYHYNNFDVYGCANQINQALEYHNKLYEFQIKKNRTWLDTIDPAKLTSMKTWTDLVTNA